ncbi:hypothetical protein DFH11DRAFT_1505886, partial [Phellopilus nigrolimitatus]
VFLYVSSPRSAKASPTPTNNNGTSYLTSDSNGTAQILDPDTQQQVVQGSASDGAGNGFNISAILWIAVVFALGVPLMTVGVRTGRFTSGIGLGLGLAVAIWACIVNSVSGSGIPDVAVFGITAILFAIGFFVGFMVTDYGVGSATLGATGGLSLGIRIILFRAGLLVPSFIGNWLVCAVFGGVGLLSVVFRERGGVIIGSASAGSFLVGLGVDLLVNKQAGMSTGLRFLFDRNSSHLVDVLSVGYKPPISTIVIIAVSIAVTPLFAYGQHKLFPRPFWKHTRRPSDASSIRPVGWLARFRGMGGTNDTTLEEEKDNSESACALVADNASDPTLIPSPTVSKYRDEPDREKSPVSMPLPV